MPYVDPPDFTGGTTGLAADVQILTDDIRYLKGIVDGIVFSGVQVSRSSNQSLASGTPELISWTAEQIDFGNWWSTGTNIVVPAAAFPVGITTIGVLAFGFLRYAANATGVRRIKLLKNGTSFGSRTLSALDGGDNTDVPITEFTDADAGDVLTVEGYQTSGGALNVTEAAVTFLRYGIIA